MRSTRLRYSILLFLGLIPIILDACSSGASDPPVTPDTTIPSTLQVNVTIAEDQDASDGAYGKSVITLGFNTNETIPPSQVIFVNGESVSCKNNNHNNSITLGNFASYWFRVAIPYNSWYTCDYHYFLKGKPESANIFSFHAAKYPLSPVLLRPVNGNFQVRYTPGPTITNSSNCTVQVTANAPNGIVTGNTTSQNTTSQVEKIYSGEADVSSLNGLGNIVMIRSCIPFNINPHNAPECQCYGSISKFDAVKVTYTSTASYEVSWVSSGSPTQGTNS
jgi:hypothetical protein